MLNGQCMINFLTTDEWVLLRLALPPSPAGSSLNSILRQRSDWPEATVATFSAKAKGLLDFAAHHQHLHAWQNFRIRDNDKRIACFQFGVVSDPLVTEGS